MKREEYISDEQVVKRANAAVNDRETQTIPQINSDGSKIEVGKKQNYRLLYSFYKVL
jgi:hypothetical protein